MRKPTTRPPWCGLATAAGAAVCCTSLFLLAGVSFGQERDIVSRIRAPARPKVWWTVHNWLVNGNHQRPPAAAGAFARESYWNTSAAHGAAHGAAHQLLQIISTQAGLLL